MKPKVKIHKRRRLRKKVYTGRETRWDFMQHWTVIRKWAVLNYELKSTADLEILMHLYSRQLFTLPECYEWAKFMSWDRHRFNRLLAEGWIHVWRTRSLGESAMYELTHKAKKMITSVYKKMTGLEPIPESSRRNKAFKKNAPFAQKTLANAIRSFNQEHKQHLSLVLDKDEFPQ